MRSSAAPRTSSTASTSSLLDLAEELGELPQPLRRHVRAGQLEKPFQLGERSRLRAPCDRRLAGGPELGEPGLEVAVHTELELERTPGASQALEDADQHRPQAARSIGGEQPQALGPPVAAEVRERGGEGLTPQYGGLPLVEHAKPRIEPRIERVGTEQTRAEAVNRRDPGPLDVAREIVPAELA